MILKILLASGLLGTTLFNSLPGHVLPPTRAGLTKAATPRQWPRQLTCFAGLDTAQGGNKCLTTKGCHGVFYKRINSAYVLRLKPGLAEQYDSCTTVTLAIQREWLTAELLVYAPGKAHLQNTCSDVVIVNAAQPRQRLKARTGQVVVAFNRPRTYYGNPTYALSLLVRRLEFVDPKTRERILVENQLLWNITNIKEFGVMRLKTSSAA